MRLCNTRRAQVGGVASAPVLAATYLPMLVPIAVLLAMLGLILAPALACSWRACCARSRQR